MAEVSHNLLLTQARVGSSAGPSFRYWPFPALPGRRGQKSRPENPVLPRLRVGIMSWMALAAAGLFSVDATSPDAEAAITPADRPAAIDAAPALRKPRRFWLPASWGVSFVFMSIVFIHRSKSSESGCRFSWELIEHASIFFSLRASQSFVFFTSTSGRVVQLVSPCVESIRFLCMVPIGAQER